MKSSSGWASFGTILALLVLCQEHEPARAAVSGEKVAAAPAPAPVELRLPPDLVFEKTVGPEQAVIFRHATHVELTHRNCVTCHPEPFRMLRPAREISHEVMNSGRSCGQCHDGVRVFGTKDDDSCATCHAGRGAADAPPAAGAKR